MIDKKKNVLSAVRLWAIFKDMEEIKDDENYTCWTDIAFKKGDKIYGFITEFDRDAKKLKSSSVFARNFCDCIYTVTTDNKKKKYIEDNTVKGMGILCYSNPYGLGQLVQILKEAELIY